MSGGQYVVLQIDECEVHSRVTVGKTVVFEGAGTSYPLPLFYFSQKFKPEDSLRIEFGSSSLDLTSAELRNSLKSQTSTQKQLNCQQAYLLLKFRRVEKLNSLLAEVSPADFSAAQQTYIQFAVKLKQQLDKQASSFSFGKLTLLFMLIAVVLGGLLGRAGRSYFQPEQDLPATGSREKVLRKEKGSQGKGKGKGKPKKKKKDL